MEILFDSLSDDKLVLYQKTFNIFPYHKSQIIKTGTILLLRKTMPVLFIRYCKFQILRSVPHLLLCLQ